MPNRAEPAPGRQFILPWTLSKSPHGAAGGRGHEQGSPSQHPPDAQSEDGGAEADAGRPSIPQRTLSPHGAAGGRGHSLGQHPLDAQSEDGGAEPDAGRPSILQRTLSPHGAAGGRGHSLGQHPPDAQSEDGGQPMRGQRGRKFTPTVQNPPILPAQSQSQVPPTQQDVAADNLPSLHSLTQSTPQEQKQMLGEHLYREIYSMHADIAGKITGKV